MTTEILFFLKNEILICKTLWKKVFAPYFFSKKSLRPLFSQKRSLRPPNIFFIFNPGAGQNNFGIPYIPCGMIILVIVIPLFDYNYLIILFICTLRETSYSRPIRQISSPSTHPTIREICLICLLPQDYVASIFQYPISNTAQYHTGTAEDLTVFFHTSQFTHYIF